MTNKLSLDDKIVVALIMAVDDSDVIARLPNLKPVYAPHFIARVYNKIDWFRSLILDKIDITIGDIWIIHFEEFIHEPETYKVWIYCNDRDEDFFRIRNIIQDEIKSVKFDTFNYAGRVPTEIENQS